MHLPMHHVEVDPSSSTIVVDDIGVVAATECLPGVLRQWHTCDYDRNVVAVWHSGDTGVISVTNPGNCTVGC